MPTALRLMRGSPVQQLQRAIKVLDQRGAAFYPVTIVAIQHAANVADIGAVDMAARHAMVPTFARLVGHGNFKVGHVVQRTLDLMHQVA